MYINELMINDKELKCNSLISDKGSVGELTLSARIMKTH